MFQIIPARFINVHNPSAQQLSQLLCPASYGNRDFFKTTMNFIERNPDCLSRYIFLFLCQDKLHILRPWPLVQGYKSQLMRWLGEFTEAGGLVLQRKRIKKENIFRLETFWKQWVKFGIKGIKKVNMWWKDFVLLYVVYIVGEKYIRTRKHEIWLSIIKILRLKTWFSIPPTI